VITHRNWETSDVRAKIFRLKVVSLLAHKKCDKESNMCFVGDVRLTSLNSLQDGLILLSNFEQFSLALFLVQAKSRKQENAD
jgi:hypothetical protein